MRLHPRYPRRLYSTKMDLRKLRSMILKRIEKRAQLYPVRAIILVAKELLQARNIFIYSVSTLLNFLTLMACKVIGLNLIRVDGVDERGLEGWLRVYERGTDEPCANERGGALGERAIVARQTREERRMQGENGAAGTNRKRGHAQTRYRSSLGDYELSFGDVEEGNRG
ncbi:hypothetical protein Fmac_008162 [Flemingia macrophylla]|uniref:Uncharacterized protein n=1 Tax=Flemingia macrophylla TaxID=520843 RepID=A0ABD1MWM4_9FABA